MLKKENDDFVATKAEKTFADLSNKIFLILKGFLLLVLVTKPFFFS